MVTQEMYDKALSKAHSEHLVIVGSSKTHDCWTAKVAHPEDPSGYYTVVWQRGARGLRCNCEAGRQQLYCKHCAFAHEFWTTPTPPTTPDPEPEYRLTDRNWKDQYAKAALEAATATSSFDPRSVIDPECVIDLDAQASVVAVAQVRQATHGSLLNKIASKSPNATYKVPAEGTYTVVGLDGGHLTIKIHTPKQGKLAGQRIAQYLCGQDNESDYAGFAFLTDQGDVRMWKRFAGNDRLRSAVGVLLHTDRAAEAGLAYALESGNCYRCGRKLTVPASIHRGLGPDCAGKVGI